MFRRIIIAIIFPVLVSLAMAENASLWDVEDTTGFRNRLLHAFFHRQSEDTAEALERLRAEQGLSSEEFSSILWSLMEECLAAETLDHRKIRAGVLHHFPTYATKETLPALWSLFENRTLDVRLREEFLRAFLQICNGDELFFERANEIMTDKKEETAIGNSFRNAVLTEVEKLLVDFACTEETMERGCVFLEANLKTSCWRLDWERMDRILCQLDPNYENSEFRKVQRERIDFESPLLFAFRLSHGEHTVSALERLRQNKKLPPEEFFSVLWRLVEERLTAETTDEQRIRNRAVCLLPKYATKECLPKLWSIYANRELDLHLREVSLRAFFQIGDGDEYFFARANEVMANDKDDAIVVANSFELAVIRGVERLVQNPKCEEKTLDRVHQFLKTHLQDNTHRGSWEWMDRMLCQVDPAYAESAFRRERRERIDRVSPLVESPPAGSRTSTSIRTGEGRESMINKKGRISDFGGISAARSTPPCP